MFIIYNRLILGKARNNETLFLFKAAITNKCNTCNKIDNVHHYLFECVKHTKDRKKFMEKLGAETLTYATIFDNSNVHTLLEYVKHTGMLNKL